jgi:hypothetical protein
MGWFSWFAWEPCWRDLVAGTRMFFLDTPKARWGYHEILQVLSDLEEAFHKADGKPVEQWVEPVKQKWVAIAMERATARAAHKQPEGDAHHAAG